MRMQQFALSSREATTGMNGSQRVVDSDVFAHRFARVRRNQPGSEGAAAMAPRVTLASRTA